MGKSEVISRWYHQHLEKNVNFCPGNGWTLRILIYCQGGDDIVYLVKNMRCDSSLSAIIITSL